MLAAAVVAFTEAMILFGNAMGALTCLQHFRGIHGSKGCTRVCFGARLAAAVSFKEAMVRINNAVGALTGTEHFRGIHRINDWTSFEAMPFKL